MYSLVDLLTKKNKFRSSKFVPFPEVVSDSEESLDSNVEKTAIEY